jgi:molybdenum cofactor guanylyltransferase
VTQLLAGIFVGGAGLRMGGVPKGLLPAPAGGALIDRSCALLAELKIPTVLVGRHPAYAARAMERLEDDPPGIGPLGGLIALLRRAGDRRAIALACDMPFVTRDLLAALIGAPDAAACAPRRDGLWEPLCAVYDPAQVLPRAVARASSGARSLQGLLDDVGATALPIDDARALRDWDTPADVADR